MLGFDIGERSRAFAALQRENRANSRLFRVNLRSGRARGIGRIGVDGAVETLAIVDDLGRGEGGGGDDDSDDRGDDSDSDSNGDSDSD